MRKGMQYIVYINKTYTIYCMNIEKIRIPRDIKESDVMEWMINTQLGRRNLPPAQRLAVMDKFKKKIQEQAALKKEESNKQFYGNRYTGKLESSPSGEQSKCKTHTDKEIAKMAGVGTVARFNKVMNSDDEELKKKVLANEVSINVGYEKVIETNIRQRGIGNPNPIKLGRCIKELERLYGIELGSNRYEKNSHLKTQKQLADEMGMSVDTLQKYKMLADMIPELDELVQTGIIILELRRISCPNISCTYVYLACKGVQMCWCSDLG